MTNKLLKSNGTFLISATVLGLAACFPDPKFLDHEDGAADAVVNVTDDAALGDGEAGDARLPDTGTPLGDAGCQGPSDCSHLAAACLDPVCLAGTCATVPKVGACDDGNPCTSNDLCTGTTCAGTPYQCDDGVACTDDLCDGQGGCNYPASNGFCQIAGVCIKAGDTKADDPCRICVGGQSWSPNDGASCDDGDMCTTNDTCVGTACVGGPRPSDAGTDWAAEPIAVVAPARAWAEAVGPAAVDDVFLVTRVVGAANVGAAPQSLRLEHESVAVVRRMRQGLVLPAIVWTGFENVSVEAYRRPSRFDEHHGLAVSLKGVGQRFINETTATVGSAGQRNIAVACFDRFGNMQLQRSWDYAVSALSCSPSRTVLAGTFNGPFSLSDAPNLAWNDTTRPNSWRAYLVSLGPDGVPRNAVWFASDAFIGKPEIHLDNDGDVWLSVSFRGSLRVSDASGQEHVLEADEEWWRYAWLRIDPVGHLVGAVMPFRFESEPESPSISFRPPEIVAWDAHGPIVVVNGFVGPQALAPYDLQRPREGVSVVGLDDTWNLRWSVALEGGGFGVNSMHNLFWPTRNGLVAPWAGLAGGVTLRSSTGVVTAGDATFGVLGLGTDGVLSFFQGLSTGQLFVSGLVGLPDGTLAVGATTVFREATIAGGGSQLRLPSNSDFNAHVFGINSNRGLECRAD